MLPERRLAALLDQVQHIQVNNCLYHSTLHAPSLYKDHVCDKKAFPSIAKYTLDDQDRSEVWQVKFSHDGSRLATCGLHRCAVVYTVRDFKRYITLDTGDEQRNNRGVGNISWSPDDKFIATCALSVKVWDSEVSTARGIMAMTACPYCIH